PAPPILSLPDALPIFNLKAQLDDQLVRRAGSDLQSSLFGAVALGVAGRLTGAAVDVMVTPAGIAALLQGHGVWKRATGDTADGRSEEHTSELQSRENL